MTPTTEPQVTEEEFESALEELTLAYEPMGLSEEAGERYCHWIIERQATIRRYISQQRALKESEKEALIRETWEACKNQYDPPVGVITDEYDSVEDYLSARKK